MKLIECVDKETRIFECFEDEGSRILYQRDFFDDSWLETEWGHPKKVLNQQRIDELEIAYQELKKSKPNIFR